MPRAGSLPFSGKALATLAAIMPAVAGAMIFWSGAAHHEPDPGPGNMPSFFPTALALMVIAGAAILWTVPQLLLLAPVWRGKSWAFMTSAILCLVQGSVPLLLALRFLKRGRSDLSLAAYFAVCMTTGIVLLMGRKHLDPQAGHARGFPIDTAGRSSRKLSPPMKDPRFAKAVVFVNAALPLAIIAADWWNGRLGANPLEFFTNATGLLTLTFLTLSLAVTPIRKLTGWNFLSHFRRMLGLYAFFYGLLHLLAFMWFDHMFDARAIAADVVKRPFVTFGMLGFFLMVPLAVTSTNAAMKRMGAKRWKLLHRLAYGSAVAGVVHYWLKVKVVTVLPMTFAIVITVLLLYRVVEALRPRARKKAPAPQALAP